MLFSLNQTSVSFPATTVGSTSRTTDVITLKSTGTAAMRISKITDSDLTDFPLSTTCPGSLPPGAPCTTTIQFKPSKAGTLSAQATVTTGVGTGTITLSGTGAAATTTAQFILNQTSFSFPVTTIGSTSRTTDVITLKSTGTAAMGISKITDSDLTDFPLSTTCPGSLAPGASCTITIQFKPSKARTLSAQATVTTCVGTGTITLSGTGAEAASSNPCSSLTVTPVTQTVPACGTPGTAT